MDGERVTFHMDTLKRVGAKGDNWCLTWAADDSLIVTMDDGNWMEEEDRYHHRIYRILGGPDDFTKEIFPGYPEFVMTKGSWFGYGICSVDGALYCFVSKTPKNHWSGPYRGMKLLKSTDNGETWYRVNKEGEKRLIGPKDEARNLLGDEEMFFFEEFGLEAHGRTAYPFSYCAFVQNGQDNQAAPDDYLYMYSPEGALVHRLLLARVPKTSLEIRASWEYFKGWDGETPTWTSDLAAREPVLTLPEKSAKGHVLGWYSWLPSVVWNPGLGLYIMVNGGTYGGSGMTDSEEDFYSGWAHEESGSLGFWYSKRPYGPWTPFYYTDYWTVDDPTNRTYQPELSPKWISDDGRKMVLVWSDAGKNAEGKSHSINYEWNQMEITVDPLG